MKLFKYSLTSLFTHLFSSSYGAISASRKPRNAVERNMNMGHFYGKVIDGNTNKPIEAASVQLTSNENGYGNKATQKCDCCSDAY